MSNSQNIQGNFNYIQPQGQHQQQQQQQQQQQKHDIDKISCNFVDKNTACFNPKQIRQILTSFQDNYYQFTLEEFLNNFDNELQELKNQVYEKFQQFQTYKIKINYFQKRSQQLETQQLNLLDQSIARQQNISTMSNTIKQIDQNLICLQEALDVKYYQRGSHITYEQFVHKEHETYFSLHQGKKNTQIAKQIKIVFDILQNTENKLNILNQKLNLYSENNPQTFTR